MVLYLRHKYSVKGHASRARSSSLVNERSRTNRGQNIRSNSASRLQIHSLQNGDGGLPQKYQFKEQKEEIPDNGCKASQRNDISVTEITQRESCILNNRDKSNKQIENRRASEKEVHFISDGNARDGCGKEKIESEMSCKGEKGEKQNLQCNEEVEESSVLKSDFVEHSGSKAVTHRSDQHASSKVNKSM